MSRPQGFDRSAVARKVAQRQRQVEGVSYGNAQHLHNGRKQTAKGKR